MSLTLFQFQRGMGVPNLSPFCMKAEILLKMTGQPFQIETMDDPRKAPKGKLPMLRDGSTDIADSTFIQTHLEQAHGVDFYPGYAAKDRAIGHAVSRMCEERLYWVMIYSRWIEPANWPKISQFWFGGMPPIICSIIPKIAQKQVKGNLQAQGVGRHTREDIYSLGITDINAVADILGDNEFLLGSTASGADAAAYPFIENALLEELPCPLLDAAKARDNLIRYAQRCRALWYADL